MVLDTIILHPLTPCTGTVTWVTTKSVTGEAEITLLLAFDPLVAAEAAPSSKNGITKKTAKNIKYFFINFHLKIKLKFLNSIITFN